MLKIDEREISLKRERRPESDQEGEDVVLLIGIESCHVIAMVLVNGEVILVGRGIERDVNRVWQIVAKDVKRRASHRLVNGYTYEGAKLRRCLPVPITGIIQLYKLIWDA